MKKNVKIRKCPRANYRAVFFDGKTIRQRIDPSKNITELKYPEFYDIGITDKCFGNCPYCYVDSTKDKNHFDDIVGKVDRYFGNMTRNERPFQVAIGGGEPTEHPDFIPLLKKFYDLDIVPNYTTNGMNLTDDIIEATKKYCGGVAVTCHRHLERTWKRAIKTLTDNGIKTCLHFVISDKASIDFFRNVYRDYENFIEYFVLLPHTAAGRTLQSVPVDTEYLFDKLKALDTLKIAFGALLYPVLRTKKEEFKISLYEPELMSKYISLKGTGSIYKSSFHSKPMKSDLF